MLTGRAGGAAAGAHRPFDAPSHQLGFEWPGRTRRRDASQTLALSAEWGAWRGENIWHPHALSLAFTRLDRSPQRKLKFHRYIGEAWNGPHGCFPGTPQTPKVHYIVRHIPHWARYFGTLGVFGCDGSEAAHPKWKSAGDLCKNITNAERRASATNRHFSAMQCCKDILSNKRKRASKKERARLDALAAEGGEAA